MEHVKKKKELILLAYKSSKYKEELLSKIIGEILTSGKEDNLTDFIVNGKVTRSGVWHINQTIFFNLDSYYEDGKSTYNKVIDQPIIFEQLENAGSLVNSKQSVSGIIIDFDILESKASVEVCLKKSDDDIVIRCIWKINTYALNELLF